MSKLNIPKYIFIITIFYFLLFCIFINPYDISDTAFNFILVGIGYGAASLVILILHKIITFKEYNSYFYTNLILL
jgi:predicted neutral ceramidase superfamily lipid hydrolase